MDKVQSMDKSRSTKSIDLCGSTPFPLHGFIHYPWIGVRVDPYDTGFDTIFFGTGDVDYGGADGDGDDEGSHKS